MQVWPHPIGEEDVMGKIWISVVTAFFLIQPGYAGEVIRVSAPPSIWTRHQGDTLTGPAVELITDLLSNMNIKIQALPMPWARAMAGMKSGNLDMILTIFYTPERARFMAFSVPYVDVPTVVFVLKEKDFPFNKDSDLMGKQGLMQRGDSFGQRFDAFIPRLTLTEIASYEQIIKMLLSGRGDYAIAPKYGFSIELKRLDHDNKIYALSRPIDVVNLHFAFSKKSPYLKYIPLINQKIKQFKGNGYIDKMVTRAILNASHP